LVTVGASFLVDDAQMIEMAFGVEVTGELSFTRWIFATYFISAVSWSGASFAVLSLINVVADFIVKRGVSDQIVGVVGGVLFWVGVDTVNLIIMPLAVEQLSMEMFSIEFLGLSAVLTVVGLTLMVKG